MTDGLILGRGDVELRHLISLTPPTLDDSGHFRLRCDLANYRKPSKLALSWETNVREIYALGHSGSRSTALTELVLPPFNSRPSLK